MRNSHVARMWVDHVMEAVATHMVSARVFHPILMAPNL